MSTDNSKTTDSIKLYSQWVSCLSSTKRQHIHCKRSLYMIASTNWRKFTLFDGQWSPYVNLKLKTDKNEDPHKDLADGILCISFDDTETQSSK